MEEYLSNEEIEIKLELSSFTEYLKLLGYIGHPDNEYCQRNFYYDSTDHQLSNSKYALRVRQEPDYGIVSLKGESIYLAQAAIRAETETKIGLAITNEIIQGERDLLSLDIKPVELVKQKYPTIKLIELINFENHRQVKNILLGDYEYKFEIDTTRFSDGSIDYELEVEVSTRQQVDTVSNSLERLFLSLEIPFTVQKKSKLQRALNRSKIIS